MCTLVTESLYSYCFCKETKLQLIFITLSDLIQCNLLTGAQFLSFIVLATYANVALRRFAVIVYEHYNEELTF